MLARTGTLPTDSSAKALYHNKSALVFIDHWLQKNLEDDFNRLGHLLGVYWTEDDLEGLFQNEEDTLESKRNKASKNLFYPLSFLIAPHFPDALKKNFGRKYGISAPHWAKQAASEGHMSDMYEWDPKDFLKFVGSVVDSVAPTKKR